MKPLVSLLLLCAALSLNAQSADELKAQALKAPKNAALNLKAANALNRAGRFEEAIPFYNKGTYQGNLPLAEGYFETYRFDEADAALSRYVAKRTKADIEKDIVKDEADGFERDWTDMLRAKIRMGQSMLARVEQVEIIDSINVPSEDFFRAYRIAAGAGKFLNSEQIENAIPMPEGVVSAESPAFVTEQGNHVIWAAATDDGSSEMYEAVRLSDGKWDTPVKLFDYEKLFGSNEGSWVAYPFLMADGVTFYFAADGEESLGNLDIFLTRRDDSGFLQPSNIGMPFNSPANDYLYAVDEENGIGWWATDRNSNGKDIVTIYTFIPRDLRVNYDPDETDNLEDLARISSIAATQKPENRAEYDSARRRIAELTSGASKQNGQSASYAITSADGVKFTSSRDFKNPEAARLFEEYQRACVSYRSSRTRLAQLRLAYGKGDASTASEIIDLERGEDRQVAEIKELRNAVLRAELQAR